MSTVKSFEDLKTWQMGRELCKEVFRIANYELFSKDYRLKDQIKPSSGSIMDNIAERFIFQPCPFRTQQGLDKRI